MGFAKLISLVGVGVLVAGSFLGQIAKADPITITNVSYDPTRELYRDLDNAFKKQWKQSSGQDLEIKVSHGGSSKQARLVIDGLKADVVSLGISVDIDAIAAKGLLKEDWESRLPNHSSPYTSTVVFLVRKGNAKEIKDWADLTRDGVGVITPNPKTSSGARWNYVAAWGWALKQNGGDAEKTKAWIGDLYKHVVVLDAGARGATTSFVEKGQGDVLLAWENEALLSLKEKPGQFEIVYPSYSVLAEPPVAVVDSVVDEHNTRSVAEAYVKFLYTAEGQELIGKNFYRPRDEQAVKKYAAQFPKLNLFTVQDVLGSWKTVQKDHFADGGIFDQIEGGTK